MKKSVAIIGCGENTEVHQLDSREFEFWGINNGYKNNEGLPWSRWFEIHRFEKSDDIYYRRDINMMGSKTVKEYLQELKDLNIPVYMQKKWKEVPKSRPFPLLQVLERFPRGHFNNSIAYQIALAIIEGFERIHVYGVSSPLEKFSEYYVHRQSTEYMLGIAEGLGIKVYIPHDSDLLKSKYLYGYQEHPGTYLPYIMAKADDNYTALSWKKSLDISHT